MDRSLDNKEKSRKAYLHNLTLYLLIFRARGREEVREKDIHVGLPLSCLQLGKLAPQPRHVP